MQNFVFPYGSVAIKNYLFPNIFLGLEFCSLNVKCKIENVKWKVKMQYKKDLKDRTKKFALRIIKMYSSLPKSMEAKVLGTQVLRSGTSVGANYREASQGRSRAEFIAKMGDCLKELEETTYWFLSIIKKTKANSKKK